MLEYLIRRIATILPTLVFVSMLIFGLQQLLPGDPALFNEFHALLVAVAKSHCRARPRCEGCPLRFDLRGRRPRG